MIMNRLPPASSIATDGQRTARAINVAIKEAPDIHPVVESLLSRLSLVAKVLLYLGLGAIVLAWEMIGKLFHPPHDSTPGGPDKPTAAGSPPSSQPAIKVPMVPIDDYSRLDEEHVIRRLDDLTETQLRVVGDFERAHLHRPRILQEIDRMLALR
jgi:hypothetical protein